MKPLIVSIVFSMAVVACSLQPSFAADPTLTERDALLALMKHQDIRLIDAHNCKRLGPVKIFTVSCFFIVWDKARFSKFLKIIAPLAFSNRTDFG